LINVGTNCWQGLQFEMPLPDGLVESLRFKTELISPVFLVIRKSREQKSMERG
jgi:hypothetical protein